MEFAELKLKPVAELQKMLKAEREKMRDLRFKVANKQLKNLQEVVLVKREIARILTLINREVKGAGEEK